MPINRGLGEKTFRMKTYQTGPAPPTPSAVSGDDISEYVEPVKPRTRIGRICHDCGSIDRRMLQGGDD